MGVCQFSRSAFRFGLVWMLVVSVKICTHPWDLIQWTTAGVTN
jgi:hypothetical protein